MVHPAAWPRAVTGLWWCRRFFHDVIFPAVAIAGAALALKDHRLALAGLLVRMPTLINWTVLVVFAISIMVYGF